MFRLSRVETTANPPQLGMIVESRWMRDLLNISISSSRAASHHADELWEPPKTYRFSMNPLPGLVILLLGTMMSGHHQVSMLSTMIHKQWGTMFVGFALARAVTYILLYISPPTSFLPSRPPSEIISAFCLIAGGITFVESVSSIPTLGRKANARIRCRLLTCCTEQGHHCCAGVL